MPEFVLDASATLAMCFPDESTAWYEALLEQVRTAAAIHVPAHWPIEVENGLWSGIRRKRIDENQAQLLWKAFSLLKVHPENPLTATEAAALMQSASPSCSPPSDTDSRSMTQPTLTSPSDGNCPSQLWMQTFTRLQLAPELPFSKFASCGGKAFTPAPQN